MTEYRTNFDLNGFTIIEADDEESAEFIVKDYLFETYPELSILDVKVTAIV